MARDALHAWRRDPADNLVCYNFYSLLRTIDGG
jgi:hypothetical protein